MIRRSRFKKTLLTLFLAAMATPALAGLIYSWEDLDPPNGTVARGSIQFADGVDFYDEYEDVVDFSFTTRGGQTFSGKDFAWEALYGVEVGGDFLCFSTCEKKAKKKVARKAKKKADVVGYLYFNDHYDAAGDIVHTQMDWYTEPAAKKKAAGTVETKEEAILLAEMGTGQWARVQIPEPQALVLLFTGLGLISLMRRRRSR